MTGKLNAKLSVRLFTDEKCFGPGIASLLLRVEKYRSLRSAAASMGMAYSKAWTILKSCEEHLGFKLIISTIGGKNGGGAELTDNAMKMLKAYNEYRDELNAYADHLLAEKFSFYADLKD
ncbi:MAG: LysR family transcriptional regulator [Ruminococcus sp.]|nr:LysR family transcriptional regulator [Ruminococcus sp.]